MVKLEKFILYSLFSLVMDIWALMFDLDGTLLTTSPEYRYLIVSKALRALKASPASNSSVDDFWFGENKDQIIRDRFGVDPSMFWPVYRALDTGQARLPYTRAFEDTTYLTELKARGHKIGIVTHAPMQIAYPELGLIGRENIDAVVLAKRSLGIEPKPSPMGLEVCLQQLGMGKERALYTGNAIEDVVAGKAACIQDVLLDRGETTVCSIVPSYKINSLYQLGEIFNL